MTEGASVHAPCPEQLDSTPVRPPRSTLKATGRWARSFHDFTEARAATAGICLGWAGLALLGLFCAALLVSAQR